MSKKISEIKREFEQADRQALSSLYAEYAGDERAGVVSLIAKYKRQEEKLREEMLRMENMYIYEHKYEDFSAICGIDEVGRGPLAGPVVAGAVILPKDCDILYLNDSKKLTEKKEKNCMTRLWRRRLRRESGL